MNGQFTILQYIDFFFRLVVACLCGASIGFERSKRLKEAGIRTHVIVCCAAALMMLVSKYAFTDMTDLAGTMYNGTRGTDPARIAAQVVSGISFLGAGVIFKHGSSVKGLTTAAGIWATAGIGLAVGAGMYVLGVGATLIIAVVQIIMHRITVANDTVSTYHLHFVTQAEGIFYQRFNEYVYTHKIQVLESGVCFEDGMAVYDMVLRTISFNQLQALTLFMNDGHEVKEVRFTPEG